MEIPTERSTTNRLRAIEQWLLEDRQVETSTLAEAFGVSAVTVRRYLTDLEERGIARRTHGGAVLVESSFTMPSYLDRQAAQRSEKLAIARQAAKLVPEAGVLVLGGGTTTLEVMAHLAGRSELTILTSNLAAAAQTRAGGARVVVLGGEVRGQDCAMVGEFARMTLATRYPDVTIIGADGLAVPEGLTSTDEQERELVQLTLERARTRRICVADHTKLGVVAPYVVAGTEALTDLVTDDGASAEVIEEFRASGVRVHVASTSNSSGPEPV